MSNKLTYFGFFNPGYFWVSENSPHSSASSTFLVSGSKSSKSNCYVLAFISDFTPTVLVFLS